MRAKKKPTRKIFAALVFIGACTLLLSTAVRPKIENRPESALGSPRLVSIEELPDYGEICAPEPANHSPSMIAALEENNLFAALPETSVHEAPPDGSPAEGTVPPVP